MKPEFTYVLALSCIILFNGCSLFRSSQTASAPSSVLKAYREVAVAPVEIIVRDRNSKSLSKIKVFSRDLDEKGGDRDMHEFLRVFSSGLAGADEEMKLEHFQDFITETINRNLLSRGFIPMERSRIKVILEEMDLQQIGIVRQEEVYELGKLARAESIFMGKLIVEVERGVFRDAIDLHFSGRLVSVTEGAVLLSGEESMEKNSTELDNISKLVNRWFRSVKKIK